MTIHRMRTIGESVEIIKGNRSGLGYHRKLHPFSLQGRQGALRVHRQKDSGGPG